MKDGDSVSEGQLEKSYRNTPLLLPSCLMAHQKREKGMGKQLQLLNWLSANRGIRTRMGYQPPTAYKTSFSFRF